MFYFCFSISLLDLFTPVPIVCFIHGVTFWKSILSILSQAISFQGHGLKAVYMPDFPEHAGRRGVYQEQQSNAKYLRICS